MIKRLFKIIIAITAVMVLVACRKSTVVDTDAGQDDSSVNDTSATEHMLNIKLHGHSYDLGAPFSQIYTDAQNNGGFVINIFTGRLMNADGSDSEDGILGNSDFDGSKGLSVTYKALDDGFIVTSFYFQDKNLQQFLSADKITQVTSSKRLPEYYIHLGEVQFDSYAVVLKDSALWDIQSYIDELPKSAGSELLEEVTSSLLDLQPKNHFRPMAFAGPWKDTFKDNYDNITDYRNNIAVIRAIESAQQSVRDGENDNMAVIYINYKDEKVFNICYYIFSKAPIS